MNIYCCRVLDQTWKFAKFRSVKNKASSKRLLYMYPYPPAARQRWRDTGCCKVSIFCNKNHCGLKLSDLNLILHDTCTERTGGAGTLRIRTKKAALCVAFRNPHGKRPKICLTYFKISQTYFEIQGTYFLFSGERIFHTS